MQFFLHRKALTVRKKRSSFIQSSRFFSSVSPLYSLFLCTKRFTKASKSNVPLANRTEKSYNEGRIKLPFIGNNFIFMKHFHENAFLLGVELHECIFRLLRQLFLLPEQRRLLQTAEPARTRKQPEPYQKGHWRRQRQRRRRKIHGHFFAGRHDAAQRLPYSHSGRRHHRSLHSKAVR